MQLPRKHWLSILTILIFAWGCTGQPSTSELPAPTNPILPTAASPVPGESPTATFPVQTDTAQPTTVPPTPTPDVLVEEVTFSTQDGIPIAATFFGDGDLPVLLLHMGKGLATNNTQVDWHPFARRLASDGYPGLTVDFRGRGESGGEFENDPVILDARAALDFLQQRGFDRYVCIGAGLGGTTCMVLAQTEPPAGLIVLSSTLSAGPTNTIEETDLAHLSMPKLIAYGEKDGFGFPEAMEDIYRRAAEPKQLVTCDSAGHGSVLLYGSCGEELYQQILSLIQDID
jgi:pimeloyl-ACP methyl ester carboxylesterase